MLTVYPLTVWVALELEGFGANLQHYNPIIDQKIQNRYNIPLEYSLKAQLVFGGRAGGPMERTYGEIDGKRLFVHGK